MVTGRTSDPGTVEQLAERIRTGVEACRFELKDEEEIKLTCPIGFACFPGAFPELLSIYHLLGDPALTLRK